MQRQNNLIVDTWHIYLSYCDSYSSANYQQKAVRSGKDKGISFEVEPGILLVNGVPVLPIQIEWPEGDPIITETSRLREGGNSCVMENGFVISCIS